MGDRQRDDAVAALSSWASDTRAWVRVAAAAPYFTTGDGAPWTPIGHNDALNWPSLDAALRSPRDIDRYFATLHASGVTCLRVMLEYAQCDGYYFEQRAGVPNPQLVATWDRLFASARAHDLRFLLTPYDTFWMWKRWRWHPYNAQRGGPCADVRSLLVCERSRAAIKARLAFAIDRWSDSPALFGWDLWNELHPAYAEDDPGKLSGFVADVANFIRQRELRRYGSAHPITVSAFGPLLTGGFRSRELGQTQPDSRISEVIFRHPALDFASVHTYAKGSIDDPRNTVAPALAMGRLTRQSLVEITDRRPFLDTEHGPIHTFKDKRRTLPAAFDEEYFRHVQWAHTASGGAGGGMRWPNRHPHVLTPGMHAAQRSLAAFLSLIDWPKFARRNLNQDVRVETPAHAVCACGDERQAVVWIVRRRGFTPSGMLSRDVPPRAVSLVIPGLQPGSYQLTVWDTREGRALDTRRETATAAGLSVRVLVNGDVALAVRATTAA